MSKHDQLKMAFELVQDPSDWRAPINKVIGIDNNFRLIDEAIRYFTGTHASFLRFTSDGIEKVVVKAIGYRNGPCGP